jgi:hypothetical protein
MTFKILSCDGGGIRGLVTALLIKDLDSSFNVISRADGFAGTSTGGLISLGLAKGVSIDDIIGIYKNQGSTIFTGNDDFLDARKAGAGVAHSIEEMTSGPGYFSCQYTNTGLIQVAESLMGNSSLKDMSKYVSVNSVRLWDKNEWTSATLSNSAKSPYLDVKMSDAALATSAAPTYFPPYQIGELGFFADGGTFANNPSVTAVADAMAGGRFSSLSDARVLSLGTGTASQGIAPSSIPTPLDWGVNYWMYPWKYNGVPAMALLNMMMDCTADVATVEASNLLGDGFCRGNVPLNKAYPLDDWKHISVLELATAAHIKSDEWKAVRKWVSSNWK